MLRLKKTCWPLLAASLLLLGTAQAAQLKDLRGESLTEKQVSLPGDLGGKRGLVLISFSHTARDATQAWSDRLAPLCAAELACYTASITEGAPAMMRGMIRSRIRERVPANRQDRYLLVNENGAAWKNAAGFAPGQEALPHLLLMDASGTVLWSAHGAVSEALQQALDAALKQ